MTKDSVAEFLEDDSNLVHWTQQELLLEEPIRSVEACTSGALLLLGDTAGQLSLLHYEKKPTVSFELTDKRPLHADPVVAIAVNPTCDLVASTSFRQEVQLTTLSTVEKRYGPCSSSCHVDASGRVLVRADTSGTFHFYDILSKSTTPQMAHKLADVDGTITALRFSPQGRYLAVASQNSVMLCDVDRILQKRSTKIISSLNGKVPAIRWGSQVDNLFTFADRTLSWYHLEFPAQYLL